MKQVRDDIADGVLTNTPNNKKGCVDEPLINCIEPIIYIPPILHIMIGMVNKLLDKFFKWVDCMVEEIPVMERNLRKDFTKNTNNRLCVKKKDLNTWCENNSGELAFVIEHQEISNSLLTSRIAGQIEGTTVLEYSVDERKHFKEAAQGYGVRRKAMTKMRDQLMTIVHAHTGMMKQKKRSGKKKGRKERIWNPRLEMNWKRYY